LLRGPAPEVSVAPLTDDREIVARIRSGDEATFDELVRSHYNGLCVFAARMVGSDAAAEELVQDVLFRVWAVRAAWVITDTVRGYLYGAVRHRALMALRRERLEQRYEADAARDVHPPAMSHTFGAADARLRGAEVERAVERAIAALSPRCREAYLLRRQHGLSYAEIARVMRIAPKTVEVQINAALRSLRASLADFLS
jgi:RNA polymerase sigma-70 factor, ECF subfamily